MTINPETKRNIADILELVMNPTFKIKPRIKNRIIKELMWAATEDSDCDKSWKYAGQPRWSEKALRRLVENKIRKRTERKFDIFKNLRHEHIITKEEVIRRIENEKVNANAYFQLLDKYAHAAVIDESEDKDFRKAKCFRSTPEGYDLDIFIRYRLSEVKLCNNITKEDIENANEHNIEDLIKRKNFGF